MPTEGTYALAGGGMQPLSAEDFIGDAARPHRLRRSGGPRGHPPGLCPDVMAGYDGSDAAKERVKMVQEAMISHCERMRYRFAVLDTPPGLNAQQAKEWRSYINFDSSYAALYYPWIEVADLSGGGSTSKLVPPSGHIVGIYNRTDAERGVHKAPANEVVRGAIDLEINLSKGEQDTLNPIGVNCIRAFPGRGIRVWGARTLSSDGVLALYQRPPPVHHGRGLDGRRPAVGGLRAQRQHPVGPGSPGCHLLPAHGLAQRCALWQHPGRGVLRQMR